MLTTKMFNSHIVSADWLKANSSLKNIIILDATINKVIDKTSQRIPIARFFDIKKKFSTIEAPFSSTLPSQAQFQKEAKNLGICNDSLIVVYDDKGIYSSARVWWLFKTYGFNTIAVLDGGLPEWLQHGFKVESYTNETYNLGDFNAKDNTLLMTNFKGVNQYSKDKNTLVIDARSQARFQCLVDEPKAGLRRGTIPNSKNLPFTDLLNGYKLKSKPQLSKIFNNLVDDKTQFVFSCGSGITACILALAATILDYKKLIVYDGSWTEYGSLTE